MPKFSLQSFYNFNQIGLLKPNHQYVKTYFSVSIWKCFSDAQRGDPQYTQSLHRVKKKKKISKFFSTENFHMPYTCLIVLDPEIPFTLPEMKGISGTDGANY